MGAVRSVPSVRPLTPFPSALLFLPAFRFYVPCRVSRSPRNGVTERHGDGVECVMRFVWCDGEGEATAAHFQQRGVGWYRHNFVYCRRRRL